jgi:hypothetical protein
VQNSVGAVQCSVSIQLLNHVVPMLRGSVSLASTVALSSSCRLGVLLLRALVDIHSYRGSSSLLVPGENATRHNAVKCDITLVGNEDGTATLSSSETTGYCWSSFHSYP